LIKNCEFLEVFQEEIISIGSVGGVENFFLWKVANG
jgi:hypothetical protein